MTAFKMVWRTDHIIALLEGRAKRERDGPAVLADYTREFYCMGCPPEKGTTLRIPVDVLAEPVRLEYVRDNIDVLLLRPRTFSIECPACGMSNTITMMGTKDELSIVRDLLGQVLEKVDKITARRLDD